ncbi:cysteine hydrolase [Pseudonocardia xishanensis]|uniref:Cysteine hydrolase n=1 Tax=Pseudonocardia xishanensis TaxID=630995 RepID=A0ABP8RH69_9PSEU
MRTSQSALVVMDYQEAIAAGCPSTPAALKKTVDAITRARAAQVPVILCRVVLRAGGVGVGAGNAMLSAVARSGAFAPGAPTAEFCAGIGTDEAIVVDKRRISAFAGSDLDGVLRSLEVDTVVLAGLYTSGVVLSTLREAADKDLGAVILSDACADPDPDLHDTLMATVFPTQAVVQDVDSWAVALDGSR